MIGTQLDKTSGTLASTEPQESLISRRAASDVHENEAKVVGLQHMDDRGYQIGSIPMELGAEWYPADYFTPVTPGTFLDVPDHKLGTEPIDKRQPHA